MDDQHLESEFLNGNKMTKVNLDELKAIYARKLIDGMDMNSLEQYAFDTIMSNLDDMPDEDVLGEIEGYDEELVARLED